MEVLLKNWIIVFLWIISGQALSLELDRSLGEYRKILEDDMRNLCHLDWHLDFPDKVAMQQTIKQDFGIDSFNCANLNTWLRERIQFLTMKTEGRIVRCSDKVVQDNEFSSFFAERDIVSSNLSQGANSRFGQDLSKEYCFKFIEDDYTAYIPFFPPKGAGIVLLGENKFFSIPSGSPNSDIASKVNSIARLAALFHEARHSDGLDFDHVPCSSSSSAPECDFFSNGPYAFEFAFFVYAANICSDCSDEEKDYLYTLAMVNFNKILPLVE